MSSLLAIFLRLESPKAWPCHIVIKNCAWNYPNILGVFIFEFEYFPYLITTFRIQAYCNTCSIKDKPEDMKQLLKLRIPSKQRLLADKLSCTSNNMLILPFLLSVEN
jgi:hypothetical protein